MNRILVIEDDMAIRNALDRGLRWEGFLVETASDGRTGYTMAVTGTYDLIILDLGLPVMNGNNVVKQLREQEITTPVIILTAHSSISEMVLSLDAGASDFVAKPYPFEELLARIRARLREKQGPAISPSQIHDDGLLLDEDAQRVLVNDRWQDLSPREFAILSVFRQHRGQVLSRRQLLTLAWGKNAQPASNLVDVYVRSLRGKIGSERFDTVRGVGYRYG